ncbi:MAG TPA: NADH-quinone oxidoreductase subunit M, partial [Candidatus Limnocylindria bacterium]|nr:NADH-quinone oxidoreductase subunit M [Candidatus Limnocylindria bacterium]
MNGLPMLTIVTFLPLAGALAIGIAPVRWARVLALVASLATWVVSLVLAAGFNAHGAGFQFPETASWIPVFGIQYKLGVDGLSLAMVLLTTTLTWISILASFNPIQVRIKEYMISFLIL